MTFPSLANTRPVILLIDDNADLRAMMEYVLETQGYGVLAASNGAEGFNILMSRKGDISCVVLDLRMPKLGGAHFAELIRLAWPSIPILVISAYADTARDVITRFDLPVLIKPFTMEMLTDAVTALIKPAG